MARQRLLPQRAKAHDIRIEHGHQPFEVAVANGHEERIDDTPLLLQVAAAASEQVKFPLRRGRAAMSLSCDRDEVRSKRDASEIVPDAELLDDVPKCSGVISHSDISAKNQLSLARTTRPLCSWICDPQSLLALGAWGSLVRIQSPRPIHVEILA